MNLKPPLIELLYQAYNAEFGIVVQTNDPSLLRTRLYAEMKKDPDLSGLSILTSRTLPESELWIVKK